MTQHKGRYNLFGLDLAELGRFYVEGWRDAMAWPVMRLFRGRDPVRVTAPDGTQSVRFGRSAEPVTFKGKVERQACELPEDLLLRRTLVMPRMSEKDLAQAMTLDARSASPFPGQDLVWGYAVRDAVVILREHLLCDSFGIELFVRIRNRHSADRCRGAFPFSGWH